MKTYFIRHKLNIDDEAFQNLLENHLIAIHYPHLKSDNEEYDTESLNPEDYKNKTAKSAIKSLKKLADDGGYVCAEYPSLKGALIGEVHPNTPIKILEVTYGNRNNLQGRKLMKM